MQEDSPTTDSPPTDAGEKVATRGEAQRYRCPGCAADLEFAPRDGLLRCPYCGRTERVGTTGGDGPGGDHSGGLAVEERSYEEYLRPHADRMGTLAEGALEVSCGSCGATVTFAPPEVAGECGFCGSKIVAQPKGADPVVTPEGVLPFGVEREDAASAVSRWIGSRWFAPNALKKFASQEEIGGVYLPFWTYDAHTVSLYEGRRGDHYFETETYTERDAQGRSVTRTRQVRRTRWRSASGEVVLNFDDILIPATKSLSPQRLAELEPWDLGALAAYEPAYLAGFKAQRYQVGLAEGFEAAKEIAAGHIESAIRRDIGGDVQQIGQVTTRYSAVTFKHLLLPVYVGAYRLNQKVYQVMVNGRTGEVQGERPYSFWKIFFFVLCLLAAVAALVLLLGGGE